MIKDIFCFCIFLWTSNVLTKEVLLEKDTKNELHLKILHNNDMHARFEQVSANSGTCTSEEAEKNNCYGGFARIAHLVRKYRNESGLETSNHSFLFLNAGDTYTGTPWFTIFKDEIASKFIKLLSPDAISLGNHEFDEGIEGLIPFVENSTIPILATNLEFSNVSEFQNSKSLKNSIILTLNKTKVGIIGYLTPDTKSMATTGNVKFLPEVESINKEARKLEEKGVKIIIALGHSGYKKDQIIAKECPSVDMVIGGHSHSFLFNEKNPPRNQPETIEGQYPTYVTQNNGKRVPVVQAYAFTKYLGIIDVYFDKDGNIKEFDGNSILLDHSIPREPDVLELLDQYRPKINELEKIVVGHTRVLLDSSTCRLKECNIGNLITEAMVYYRVKLLDVQNSSQYWTDAPIAFIQGGGIRASLDKTSNGNITMKDILTVLPFEDKILLIEVHGKTILEALEHSAKVYGTDSSGGFLQMYGLRVEYNMKKQIGQRVIRANILCSDCDIPEFKPLNKSKLYKTIIPNFLYEGGDDHVFKETNVGDPIEFPKLDYEVFSFYLQTKSVVYTEIDERIKMSSATSKLVSFWKCLLLLALVNLL